MLARVEISVPGKPYGKGRPREAGGHFYTPKETAAAEAQVRVAGAVAMAGRAPMLGPVRLVLEAVFEMPVSWPPRVREMRQLPHVSKPDLDNIEKLVLDGLNGVAFADDSQICEVAKRKRYGDGERVDIILEELATTVDHPAVKRAAKRAAEPERYGKRGRVQRRAPARAPRDAPIGKRLK
jgi:Holliday junction resolvase RusA-like endonuclease